MSLKHKIINLITKPNETVVEFINDDPPCMLFHGKIPDEAWPWKERTQDWDEVVERLKKEKPIRDQLNTGYERGRVEGIQRAIDIIKGVNQNE